MRVAEGNRPQVLNASTSTSSATSKPLPDGDTVSHEEGESLSHRDERQIMLDTDRSFVQYPSGEGPPPYRHPDPMRPGRDGMLTLNHCRLKERATR